MNRKTVSIIGTVLTVAAGIFQIGTSICGKRERDLKDAEDNAKQAELIKEEVRKYCEK